MTKLIALVAALVLLLAGCGSSGEKTQAGEPDGKDFPATVATAFGPVTVAHRPQRVVALGWSDAETALALGVQPVGAADWLGLGGDGLGPWVQQRYQTAPKMLGTKELDVEAVAALKPDLILDTKASGDQQRYDKLRGLGVPVVSIPDNAQNYKTNWRQQLTMIGQAVGRADKAAQMEKQFTDELAKVKKDNPEFVGATVAVGARSGTGYGAYVDGTSRVDFLRSLGFLNSPKIQQRATKEFSVSVSHERMDLFDADLTVMFPVSGTAKDITDDPVYRAVGSVRQGHSVVLDKGLASALAAASVPSLRYAIGKTVPLLAEKLHR